MHQACGSLASIVEHLEALPPASGPSSGGAESTADLMLARDLWHAMSAELFSAFAPLSAADVDAASGGQGLLHHMSQCMQLSHFVGDGDFVDMVRQ